MKVDLINDTNPREHFNSEFWLPILPLKRSLPFYTPKLGSRAHRVRSAQLHRPTTRPHYVTVKLWCGQGGYLTDGRGMLTDEPLEGWPVCGTCEGRAVGSGQLGSRELTGKELLFTPQPGQRIECVWERGSRGYCWTSYYKCWTRARFIGVKEGEDPRPTCLYHSRSNKAINAGWVFEPIPAPFAEVPG